MFFLFIYDDLISSSPTPVQSFQSIIMYAELDDYHVNRLARA